MASVQKERDRLLAFYSQKQNQASIQNEITINLVQQQAPKRHKTMEISDINAGEKSNEHIEDQKSSETISTATNFEYQNNNQMHNYDNSFNIDRPVQQQPSYAYQQNYNWQQLEQVQNINDIIRLFPSVVQHIINQEQRIQYLENKNNYMAN
ncbi:hypothetical protein TTHERM_00198010 (macronuclear) [Tetrahymena thermophila SB210]|uniref:Uncharacterized protein n=1 Tax=Tetrahymena thermophila (strain SB210) TaxID=312017 RepID=Q22NP8_TETTS|nr:hypothetical protein TTHERM_00198010 [Tetrahymena thermophila SB210]EAR86737.1 hypothetical protein TTHERM_00198010 [Tetrahymena thermophila SB210]|eukprot:XP_001006982.1 hypothetical protein TTHERM_00198010 [Tetrahymena thermophila SB210]